LQLKETSVNVLFFLINSLILGVVQIIVGLDKGKVGLGGNVDVPSHLLEVFGTDIVHHLVHLAHVDFQLLLDLVRGIDLEFGDKLRRHRNERLLWPW
jgi:hypothetical protein